MAYQNFTRVHVISELRSREDERVRQHIPLGNSDQLLGAKSSLSVNINRSSFGSTLQQEIRVRKAGAREARPGRGVVGR